ncbi:hypothetical protein [Helicobacter trogontum]|uniref:Uncharacterized protein n=1 Tax=Helicobacter trogontum TaxID=50960 RepID=A0A4U8S938_9HELI|nr:hypothetical protein [Helicobacter trogontum]TLD82518.1 hypothetical protein LS81_007575 [Helicobacter trogontum]
MIQPTHIQNLLSQMATTTGNKEINATLPMLLRILDKKGADRYLVQLGKLIIETQSNKELQIGTNYWANVKQSKDGLLISDLIKQPKMLENLAHAKLKLSSNDLKELLNETHKNGNTLESVFKEFLLERLPLATSKQEFLELSNLLVALQNGVFSMVIQEDNGKESLVQLKKQVEFLEFYSIFHHLGEINGIVSLNEESSVCLRLCVMSEKVKKILENRLHELQGFEEIQIDVGQNEPLWDLESFEPSYILNLKG